MTDFIYRPQHVDYLGFLEAQLRDLQGIDRLAYELIQNADDVQVDGDDGSAPTRLTFDVTDDALVVKNDAAFRPIDFQRLQRLASGGKRDEPDTTGAFGLGFIAVYQVTDAPEIFSNNLHWTIHPDAPPDRRIQERPAQTDGTRFVLPWAFDGASPIRRALRIEAIDPRQLDDIARQLADAIGLAALFLKQLNLLEVRRNGQLLRRQQRRVTGQRLDLVEAAGESSTYLLLRGDFSAAAERLRQAYAWQIEAKRHSAVTIAVPLSTLPEQGRLFAVLPTDAVMPLPLYINADFYPTTDRRRIHFEEGYQARWNEQALACAARILAENIEPLRRELQPYDFWLLQQRAWQTAQLAEQGEVAAPFALFWEALPSELAAQPTVYASDGDWYAPPDLHIVEEGAVRPALQGLGVTTAHADLSPFYPLLRLPEIGVPDFTLASLRPALRQSGITPGLPLALAPPVLINLDNWRPLWQWIERRLATYPRHEQRRQAQRELGDLPLVVDENMTLTTLRQVYRGDSETRALFPDLSWLHPALDETAFPGSYVTQFGVRQAVDILSGLSQEQLQEAWQMGRLDLPRLFRWFEARPIEIFADDPALQREILNLPLAPIDGELQPLAHLYVPGGFEDPLNLAGVVDVEALGGRRQFLHDLGLQPLDFESYVRSHLPRVLSQNPDLPSDARHQLLHLLAQRLGEMRDDEALRHQLSHLPLIPTMEGAFRPARDVYASRHIARLLGPRTHVAEPPQSQAIEALYQWLGVRTEPAASDLLQRIVSLAAEAGAAGKPPGESDLDILLQCWQRLEQIHRQKELSIAQIAQLQERRTLPNQAGTLSEPGRLLFVDQPELLARFNAAPDALQKYLLHAGFSFSPLLAAAGVRPLTAALQLEVSGEGPPTAAPQIEQRLQERRPLLARLLPPETGTQSGPDPLLALENLQIQQIPALHVHTHLTIGQERFITEAEARSALFIAHNNTLFVDAAKPAPPWAAIARELAALISADVYTAGLALGIRELLSAATYDEAAATLDELGYP